MNDVPPGHDQPDDLDDLYRRASDLDPSRPSESVHQAVLRNAARLAAQTDSRQPAGRRTPWRPVAFGTLAAAALAGLLIVPRFLTPRTPLTAARAPSVEPLRKSEVPAETPGNPSSSANPVPDDRPRAPSPALSPAPALSAAQAPAAAPALPVAPALPAPPGERMAELSNHFIGAARSDASSDTRSDAAPEAAAPARARSMPSVRDTGEALRRAAQIGDIPGLQALFDQRVAIDARDSSGRTALMLATLHGQTQAVEALLAHGADPNAADADGTTPLHAAMAGDQPAIVAALRSAGAQPRTMRHTD
jgi:hypothetical protein